MCTFVRIYMKRLKLSRYEGECMSVGEPESFRSGIFYYVFARNFRLSFANYKTGSRTKGKFNHVEKLDVVESPTLVLIFQLDNPQLNVLEESEK